MAVSLVWFKRDLRAVDHAPLCAAACSGRPVLPVYVIEPELWAQPDASGRQWSAVAEALAELRIELSAMGAPLRIVQGDALACFEALHAAYGFVELHAHEETGNAWTFARDRKVQAWCRVKGISLIEHPNGSTVRRLAQRDGWVRHWGKHNGLAPLPAPAALGNAQPLQASQAQQDNAWSHSLLPTAADLGLAVDACPKRQPGGRASALRLLSSFVDGRGANYTRGMSSPLSAAKSCSRLSLHFATGALSIREANAAVRHAAAVGLATPPRALKSFESRLHWQGHFMQKLESEPAIEFRNVNRAFDGMREQDFNAEAFEAWARGETGWPFVDACMRMLQHTGWINFRMRAMLMAVASYQLWLHWREPGLHLARLFTDYEPGIHWPQVQMQSGVTGINIPRMYNPIKQGLDQDPEGDFVRRWVPELAGVPAPWIHMPRALPESQLARHGVVLGHDYPNPIRDHEQAAREAKAKVAAWRQSQPALRELSRGVFLKHGSRMRKTSTASVQTAKRESPATHEATQGDLFG